jgi:AraC family transcriptional activator of tynA and feaB
LQRRSLASLDILQITTATPHRVVRPHNPRGSPGDDYYFASVGLWGSAVSCQDGQEALLRRRVLVVEDSTRPYQLTLDGNRYSQLALRIPGPLFRQRVSQIDGLVLARGITHHSELVGLFAGFVLHLFDLQQHNPFIVQQLENQTLDLLAMVLMQSSDLAWAEVSLGRAATLYRIKRFVEQHLSEPELSPANMGISSRYMNKLFVDENTSLMRYVWDRRLEHCRRDLTNPIRVAGGISQIAFRWGFNELSHFSRSFKARFGLSPRAYLHLNVRTEHVAGFGPGLQANATL